MSIHVDCTTSFPRARGKVQIRRGSCPRPRYRDHTHRAAGLPDGYTGPNRTIYGYASIIRCALLCWVQHRPLGPGNGPRMSVGSTRHESKQKKKRGHCRGRPSVLVTDCACRDLYLLLHSRYVVVVSARRSQARPGNRLSGLAQLPSHMAEGRGGEGFIQSPPIHDRNQAIKSISQSESMFANLHTYRRSARPAAASYGFFSSIARHDWPLHLCSDVIHDS